MIATLAIASYVLGWVCTTALFIGHERADNWGEYIGFSLIGLMWPVIVPLFAVGLLAKSLGGIVRVR